MNYRLGLHKILQYTPSVTKQLMDEQISAEEIFTMRKESLWLLNIFSEKQLYNIEEIKKHGNDADVDDFEKSGQSYVCIEDNDYPEKLRNIHTPPYGIFYYGRLPDENAIAIGVVGSRNCSPYGSVIASKIGRELGKRGMQIISGLARGVDSCSQGGALEVGGSSFGILGCGADVCYPRENIRIYNELKSAGGIISEYLPKTAPLGPHFPLRNRIISGFSDVVIVVEARRKSGSLITADYALEQGKEIYAVPGQIDSKLCDGTNFLIKQGAGIFLSVEDFLNDLSVECVLNVKKIENKKSCLVKEENIVYSVITLWPKGVEEIMLECKMSLRETLAILGSLTAKGYIAENGKNMYVRTGS